MVARPFMPLYYNPFNEKLNTEQQKTNAVYIWGYLRNKGFSLNAVSGILGNFQAESTLNPNIVETKHKSRWDSWGNYGYGIAQWTPWYTKKDKNGNWYDPANYHGTNKPTFGYWAEKRGYTTNKVDGGTVKDMNMQLDYIAAGEGGYHKTDIFPYSFEQFKTLTIDAGECAKIWYKNYERSEIDSVGNRPDLARKWFLYLGGVNPPQPPETSNIIKGGKNVWLLLHLIQK